MSRIGRKTILIPSGVSVEIKDGVVYVKGPKGELSYSHRPEIGIKIDENEMNFEIVRDVKEANAYWGLSRALVANMILGVTEGFEKKLELVGVGYRVKPVNETEVELSVGYSHPVKFQAPEGITLGVEENKGIIIKGIDKQLVGLTASQIRKVRPPEPYKGKGIRYVDEVVIRKPGKAGKV